ncbi:MAG TPA: murein biosynthesis integral membrane protein MurJ [Syntrophales bacterium]|nr:murein biosynthesis integral membrane protein MurJ [Syntrophales bacterium]
MKIEAPHSESENLKVVKAAGVVGLATGLSRVFGYIRDMVVAHFFGAGMATDAFFVAFRIPNLLRRLLAEGSLTVSFVPVFMEYLKRKSREDALELANVSFTLLSIILVVISVAGVLLSPLIVTIMAPGFMKTPDKYALTVFLTRLMFPYIFFISLVALCMGILNSLRHFAAPALSPVVLNISMIAAALTLRPFFPEPITALAVGVIIGGILQLALQFPFLLKLGVRLKPDFRFNHPGVRKVGLLMLPAVFGAAVYQINIFISTLIASFLPGGSVSYLYYADRVVELPLGIFGIAIGTASLPSLSAQVARGEIEAMKKTLTFSLRLILFIAIPAMIALVALREPIISVLFQRGEFDAQSTALTAQALFYYSLGLWAFSGIRVVVSAFYSFQDTKTPVYVGIVALVVNTVFSIILMFPLKHGGLALATSIATAVNMITLSVILKRRIGRFLDREFYRSVSLSTVASLIMWAGIASIELFLPWNEGAPFMEKLSVLSLEIAAGLAVFLVSSYMLKSSELAAALEILRHRLTRRPTKIKTEYKNH